MEVSLSKYIEDIKGTVEMSEHSKNLRCFAQRRARNLCGLGLGSMHKAGVLSQ